MTFDQYIQNPMGIKNAVFSGRDLYRKMYTEKWQNIKLRENGVIIYNLYNSDNDFIVHFKIPSEVVPKFYYDTIIRFYPPDKTGQDVKMLRTLNDYEVQFYSNDPSFVYTFAHAFEKNNLLFRDLDSKMSKLALREPAKERNPQNQVGYVKSIYFAYLEMRSLNLFQKIRWDGISKAYSKNVWKNTVIHADDKIKDRQEKGEAIRKKEKRIKIANKNSKNIQPNNSFNAFSNNKPNVSGFGHYKGGVMKNTSVKKTGVIKDFGKYKKGK